MPDPSYTIRFHWAFLKALLHIISIIQILYLVIRMGLFLTITCCKTSSWPSNISQVYIRIRTNHVISIFPSLNPQNRNTTIAKHTSDKQFADKSRSYNLQYSRHPFHSISLVDHLFVARLLVVQMRNQYYSSHIRHGCRNYLNRDICVRQRLGLW